MMMGGVVHFTSSTQQWRVTSHGAFMFTFWRALDNLRGQTPFLGFVPSRNQLEVLLNQESSG
jgi:hypothetical protein